MRKLWNDRELRLTMAKATLAVGTGSKHLDELEWTGWPPEPGSHS